ncbi:hypothetical protein, partial [Citrobacter youngae]|uniref:hypothetical protein n=1 Tax=Citrobacter youngae TaxID=133448 RepID=UPI0013D8788F
ITRSSIALAIGSGSEDENFSLHDVVEVLYHGGWLLGVVSQIPNGSKYIVRLRHYDEEMELE